MAVWPKTVTSRLALLGLESAKARGISPAEFRRITGITELETKDPQGRIAAAKHIAMLNLMERSLPSTSENQSLLAIPLAAPFSTVIGIVANSPTLKDAYLNYLRFRALIGDVDDLRIKEENGRFEFEYVLDGDHNRTSLSAFGNLITMAKLARQYTEDDDLPVMLELTGKPFASEQKLQDVEKCKVRFGQSHNRLVLNLPTANARYHLHNRTAFDAIHGQAVHDLKALYKRHSFAARVEGLVEEQARNMSFLAEEHTTLEMVCGGLNMSRFSLHRRLQKEGTNLRRIMNQVRLEKAKELLMQNEMSVSNISDMLGFSSVSVFSRFFSEQSGTSPSRYKSLHTCD